MKITLSISQWKQIGKKAGWEKEALNWDRLNPREKLNWLDRSELESILESVSIACYPNESDDTLRDAIVSNIEDGTLDVSVLER
jgi:hypothetical protein